MTLSDVGEFTLIDRLASVLGRPSVPGLLLGIGDDAAAWRPTAGAVTVATTDALVQGVHFDLATTSWTDLGWKALAQNVSDVAAMGCDPCYALVTLALPPEVAPADVEALYAGVRECADSYGCAVVGGDVVASPVVVISIALIGESLPGVQAIGDDPPLLTRSAARAGDVLAVTGALGASAAGLRVLNAAVDPTATPAEQAAAPHPNPPPQGGRGFFPSPLTGEGEGGGEAAQETSPASVLVAAHRRPTPRVGAGRALVKAGVRCAIDVSDGLLADVGHICERSGVDAEIDATRVPVHAAAMARYPEDALELALTGGEDYELVCAGPAAAIDRARELLRAVGAPELTVIGKMLPAGGQPPRVRVRGAAGETIWLDQPGYQHFASAAPNGATNDNG